MGSSVAIVILRLFRLLEGAAVLKYPPEEADDVRSATIWDGERVSVSNSETSVTLVASVSEGVVVVVVVVVVIVVRTSDLLDISGTTSFSVDFRMSSLVVTASLMGSSVVVLVVDVDPYRDLRG